MVKLASFVYEVGLIIFDFKNCLDLFSLFNIRGATMINILKDFMPQVQYHIYNTRMIQFRVHSHFLSYILNFKDVRRVRSTLYNF